MIDRTTTVIIGAGQAGLAMSRNLTERSIDHVILERGEVANSWRRERWDSLRLLTPNWQTRLPGKSYDGADPEGFMTMPEVVGFMSAYAHQVAAPVRTHTEVTAVRPYEDGYLVTTNRGNIQCRSLVIASGACNLASVPKLRSAIPTDIECITPMQYKNPDSMPEGGVLVVGASATGVQLANEIHRSGRPVTLAVGEHVRMPRRYRGRDVLWWMDASGRWDESYDEIDDVARARSLPSPQLVGTADGSTLDLNTLSRAGVELVGRLTGVRDRELLFSGTLRNVCALADLKMERTLDGFDEWADQNADGSFEAAQRFSPTRLPESPRLSLDLSRGEVRTIVWATGFRPDYSWLQVPVLDRKGRLRHDGGVVEAPGMYVLGLPVLRRRKSSFIHGAADDAHDLSAHLQDFLAVRNRPLIADRTGPVTQQIGA